MCWFYPIFKTSKADLMETNERLSKKMSLHWMKIQNFAQNSEEKLEKETFAMTVKIFVVKFYSGTVRAKSAGSIKG